MAHTKTAHTPDTTNTHHYETNPFLITFRSLGLLFTHNAIWAIVLLALAVLGILAQMFQVFIQALSEQSAHASSLGASSETFASAAMGVTAIVALIIVIFTIVLVSVVISIGVGVFIQGLFSYVALKSLEGKSVSADEAFKAVLRRYWRLLGAQLLAMVKIFGWSLLLIVPGIVASFRYALLTYVIMDEPEDQKGVSASHNRVKTLVKGRLLEIFGISFVAALIPLVGELLRYTGGGAQYRQLQVYHDQSIEKPKIHWLNYLALTFTIILVVGIFIGLILIGILASVNN